MNTKDKILDKALELMNKKGHENISTHDIARALTIRQSNITYYFPTRLDIINALAKLMIVEVDDLPEPNTPEEFSLLALYKMVEYVMNVHLKYRFILMNYAPIITADKELNKHYITVMNRRDEEFKQVITLLEMNRYVKKDMIQYSSLLMLQVNMIGIYWIQEAAIYNHGKSDEVKRKHYLRLFFLTFIPYLTKKGEEELLPILGITT
jgi:AcrR family transcriptional regulator